ncbi:MAG: hypothetical protein KGJ74_02925 [Betaproteobacteria bacterium]|jgi:hypothetical protein|uniref:ABC transporter ATP-binding membrane protein n=1 Tax=Thiomonas delicata TaxID=364030 RepID=A0A238D1K7_THIDL|nr:MULTISPECIES: hypothetical protein [Thiomonas]MDE2128603.1 hypothetical protein [Betaproteobacteria bacterium]SBP87131.1 ABC transporter ATP-binding membrane protein [Thiomonas delicata]
MKKVMQLIFGDVRNIASVAAAVLLAWTVARWAPAASGWVLVAALIAASVWQGH